MTHEDRSPDPKRGRERRAALGDDPRGPERSGPDPQRGRATESALGDEPHAPPWPGPDREHAEETRVRSEPDRPS